MSSIVNKIKEAVRPDKYSNDAGTAEGVHGPHESRLANAADPRVDSDMDNRAGPEYSTSDNYTHATGATSGAGFGTAPAPNTAGPHSSDFMNKVDPRVDSDQDGSKNMGFANRDTAAATAGGTTATTGAAGGVPAEPHPTATGAAVTGGGPTGARSGPTVAGRTGAADADTFNATTGDGNPYNNAGTTGASFDGQQQHVRPTNTAGTETGMGTTGPAPNTAGPHGKDILNKADPRVDSDLDGSRTLGNNNNQTFQQSSTGTMDRDPTDAAQVPPSVLRQHVGDVSIHHTDHTHDRERRNSSATHQETFRGI